MASPTSVRAVVGVVAAALLAQPARGGEPFLQPGARFPTTGKGVPVLEPLDAAVLSVMGRHGLPGAALAIVREGKLVHARGYGWANLASRQPVQPDTPFGIASLSKPLTAVAALRLVEQGKLSLDDHPFQILSQIKPLPGARPDPRLGRITVRQLLNHSGGWDHKRSGDPVTWTTQMQLQRGDRSPIPAGYLIAFTMGVPLDFDPGTDSRYSNFGYIVLGEVIERVSGRPYEDYVRDEVLKPMGLTQPRLHPAGGRYLPNEARRYMAGDDQELPAWQQKYSDAAGGWTASAVDLLRFVCALDGSRGKPFLGERTVRVMLGPPPPPLRDRADGTHVGLGWDTAVVTPKNEYGFSKDGSWFGMRGFLARQFNGVSWALLFNASMQPDAADARTIGDAIQEVRQALGKQDKFPDVDLFDEYR